MPSPRGGVARVRSQQRRERHAVQLGHGRVLLGAREVEERRGQVDVLRLRAREISSRHAVAIIQAILLAAPPGPSD